MELRKIGDNELHELLLRQWTWLTTGRQGEPTRLNNLDLRGCVMKGADLSGADLSGTDLTGSDLSNASLVGANLSEANLSRATLRIANLKGLDLRKTTLAGVQLYGANLSYTDLRGASLSNAHLMDSNLQCSDLRGAYLPEANLIGTNLIEANLSGADLPQALFTQSRLTRATLRGAKLREANFEHANLDGADLSECDLTRAEFFNASLVGTQLERADLSVANFYSCNLSGANLRSSTLMAARLIETNLQNADLTAARVYGASAWNVNAEGAIQKQLIVTPPAESTITVDDLELAQFIYLLLNRKKIRNMIDTITAKGVLILGRFTSERKAVLEGLADELRAHDLVPIIFDFERSTNRDFTETIKTLAGMCFFVIADVTNPKSAPLELQATVPDYQVPFVPIIQAGEKPFSMFQDLARYDWVLKPVVTYESLVDLREAFDKAILDRAFNKHIELKLRKAQVTETMSARQFLQQGT